MKLLLLSAVILLSSPLSREVNPFIGASTNTEIARAGHGMGKTFPGATRPFGMAQATPITVTGGDNAPGYSYEHTGIEGFAMTAMSGVGWYGDLGNLMMMPAVGPLEDGACRKLTYDKQSETAWAGYYSVVFPAEGIKAECSATPHCSALRFSFPEGVEAGVQADLFHRSGGTATAAFCERRGSRRLSGWIKCTPETGGWGHGAGNVSYTLLFCIRFSRRIKNFTLWENGRGFSVSFGCLSRPLELTAGLSFVDAQGAARNWRAEARGKSFAKISAQASAFWDKALSVIEVEGGTPEERHIFYTALYHTMIDPRVVSDVDGRFMAADGCVKHNCSYTRRTIFSGWDVFRSQFPLQTIINPTLVSDTVNSLVDLAEESGKGYLERWELLNAYSGCMLGNPAVVVLADAVAKGIIPCDLETAYTCAKASCDRDTGNPSDISSTLECAYSDWCLSELARMMGKEEDAKFYYRRSLRYRNLFNPETGWFQPKGEDGKFIPFPSKGRLAQDFACTESNPYQQGWFVPHDFDAFVEMLGGREKAVADLESMFRNTPEDYLWNDFYNHANEPVHHIPFLFNRLGRPDLTQYWSRDICEKAYHDSVFGLVGNDDVGQMSAWYVLAASGIHPVCPGDPVYEITVPVFDSVRFNLPGGKVFTVRCGPGVRESRHADSAVLDGKLLPDFRLGHREITAGAELVLE